jgi:hypothetical protein
LSNSQADELRAALSNTNFAEVIKNVQDERSREYHRGDLDKLKREGLIKVTTQSGYTYYAAGWGTTRFMNPKSWVLFTNLRNTGTVLTGLEDWVTGQGKDVVEGSSVTLPFGMGTKVWDQETEWEVAKEAALKHSYWSVIHSDKADYSPRIRNAIAYCDANVTDMSMKPSVLGFDDYVLTHTAISAAKAESSGNYASVAPNDNDAFSFGISQFHLGKAKECLEYLANAVGAGGVAGKSLILFFGNLGSISEALKAGSIVEVGDVIGAQGTNAVRVCASFSNIWSSEIIQAGPPGKGPVEDSYFDSGAQIDYIKYGLGVKQATEFQTKYGVSAWSGSANAEQLKFLESSEDSAYRDQNKKFATSVAVIYWGR